MATSVNRDEAISRYLQGKMRLCCNIGGGFDEPDLVLMVDSRDSQDYNTMSGKRVTF